VPYSYCTVPLPGARAWAQGPAGSTPHHPHKTANTAGVAAVVQNARLELHAPELAGVWKKAAGCTRAALRRMNT